MAEEFRTVVLIDNMAPENLRCEWGLSFYIVYQDRTYLLDMGTTGDFALNAKELRIDLNRVDAAVLSHAHYDHGDGMEAFFAANDHAKLYIRKMAGENCYGLNEEGNLHYIGLKRGLLERYADRIVRVDGNYELADGVYLLGHTTPGLEKVGRRGGMKIRLEGPASGTDDFSGEESSAFRADDFSHEQSLVFRTEKGLVVFNSCSHAGPELIIREVLDAFPGEKICMYLGGLHQFRETQEHVRELGKLLKELDVDRIYTGHCTGEAAFHILREELGDRIVQFESGFEASV